VSDKSTKIEEEKAELKSDEPRPTLTFTPEALKSAWEEYRQLHKDDGNNFELVILNKEYTILKETEIHLELSSDLELDRLKTLKPSLVEHLRSSLSNYNIDIFEEVKQEVGSNKAYTNSDKFKVMIEKNPALAELKDRLGLDPDI